MTFEAFKQGYGVRLETEKKELAKFDGYLDCNKITSGIQRCTDPTDGLTAEFVDDKLSELMWILKHHEFDVIREGLIEKFGNGKMWQTTLQNRMGATFTGEIRQWVAGDVTMKIDEYSSTLDESSVTLTDRRLNSEFVKRQPSTSPDI